MHFIISLPMRWSISGGPVQVLAVSVIAPVVEDSFAGVCTGICARRPQVGMVEQCPLASATIVSFLFAVVHPQGLMAVPVLTALAYAFALAREWRGTLVPAMVCAWHQ